ncbi:MAG TPA: glycosyltransferase [Nitrospiraceae bacterium]|nr:glycosyltransferase [Nitrospiraceae bacterium]
MQQAPSPSSISYEEPRDRSALLSGGEPVPQLDKTISLSVVVPTYQRPELLQRCLSALTSQTMDADRYEIIVVDDGASLDTWKAVKALAASGSAPAIRYLASFPRKGPAAARNLGWRAARGDVIAFTDDDCIASPDWLAAGWAMFADLGLSGAWGRIVVPLPEEPTDHDWNTKGLERSPCATANCFYRKTALASVGGFDERFTTAWREDSDLQFTLLERGGRLTPCDRAVVVHPARSAPWGISLRQQRNNLFNALLYKKHPDLYRNKLQARPPWRYYVIVGALLGTTVAGIMMPSPAWAIGFASIWAGLTAEFCVRRLRNTTRRPGHVAEMIITSALIPPLAIFWRLLGAIRYRTPFL